MHFQRDISLTEPEEIICWGHYEHKEGLNTKGKYIKLLTDVKIVSDNTLELVHEKQILKSQY